MSDHAAEDENLASDLSRSRTTTRYAADGAPAWRRTQQIKWIDRAIARGSVIPLPLVGVPCPGPAAAGTQHETAA